jgi:hypothetical protein
MSRISPRNREGWCSESVQEGVQDSKELRKIDLKQFLSMVCFDARQKLDDLANI